ncbi:MULTISPECIES: aminoglycoside nucleotidyltransferase ANT9 [unclassified Streptomyces]|uniref:aminoglycoside nucleotidyltransferase ANT9 n=1 Tax=unclassified Streptomyces TaxID=2593676 RepID=UPI0004C1F43A|nr:MULTISPECIES: aminoglycoside nucleotidyltransferase ANT9 [unclassified Streptomyces]
MPDGDADPVVRLVNQALGDLVLGIYLHGSAALGGLRPHSDVDVLAVVREPTTHAQRRLLVGELMRVSGVHNGRRPVELIVVVQRDVRPWRYPPTCEFLYGEWLRGDYERGMIPAPEPCPDLAPLLSMVLLADAPLHGPRPAELLDPVPVADLRRAIVAGVPELMAEVETDTRNVLLTLARVWTTLDTGSIRSKDAAAEWAIGRLPAGHRPALAHARAVYLGEAAESWDGLGARACAEFLARVVTGSHSS